MYATRIIRSPFHWRTITITVLLCMALVAVAGLVLMRLHQYVPIPQAVRSQVHFAVFVPGQDVSVDQASYKFDSGEQVLSFTGHLADGQPVTFAEQATPASFTDIPDFYPKFLEKLYEYQAFDGLQGTVHLTHPKGAGQAAVMNAKGTLVFARVAQDESRDTWRSVFNAMRIYSF